MTVAGIVFDIYDDYMYKVAAVHKGELTGTSVMDPVEVEALDDKDFALVIKTATRSIRKYPIADADSTKLSMCYFNALKGEMHPAIVKTAEAGFKRGNNVIDISKLSSADVVTHAYKSYPLHNAEHVKEAMDKFAYTAQRMSPQEKYAYAQAIVDRAADLSVMVDGPVLHYVSSEVNPVSVKLGCLSRAQCVDNSYKADLDAIALDPHPEKFAAFDKLAGLTQYVNDGKVPDGYATCFSCLNKTANLEDERILNIPLTTIESLFDASFAKEWQKDPVAVYKSLPTPTQTMIEKNAGVSPSAGEKLGPAFLAMLATAAIAKDKGALSAIDKMLASKGWVKKDGEYFKNEECIVRKDGEWRVIDKDNACRAKAESLIKLYNLV